VAANKNIECEVNTRSLSVCVSVCLFVYLYVLLCLSGSSLHAPADHNVRRPIA